MDLFKNKFSKFFIVSFLIIGIYSCSDDNDTTTEVLIAKEIKNVAYGSDSDQVYDIYLPADRSEFSTKTFVLVHGGSWVSGDKDDLNSFVSLLKFHFPEFAIVNINYRLAGVNTSPFPMQTDDIQTVLNHLESNSEAYQIQRKFAFIGTSAGAHLSMLYAYKHDTNFDVEMVCSIVGPTNFTDINYTQNPDYANMIAAFQLVTGVSIVDNPSFYEDLSPLHVVTASAPPTILFYGGQDELVPTTQGVDMDAKLTELNIDHEFTLYENEGHGWGGINGIDTTNKLVAFINQHF